MARLDEAIISRINRLKKGKDVFLLVHNYQPPEIQDIGDFVGDSFGLAQKASDTNAIRAGILGLTKTLSNEYAADNILINAVCPGWTLTERLSELAKSKAEKTGKEYPEIIDEWNKKIPVGRLADLKEIANLVIFLASERASYITGNTVQVGGGFIKSIF